MGNFERNSGSKYKRSGTTENKSDSIVCWKCNEEGHIGKECPNILKINKDTICLGCRRKGHNLATCPSNGTIGLTTCYTCGKEGHASRNCPQAKNKSGTPDYSFAECFICKKKGHISSQCPENKNKLYPKGGSCFRCGSVDHLARNCSLPRTDVDPSEKKKDKVAVFDFNDETAPVITPEETSSKKKKRSKVEDSEGFAKIAAGDSAEKPKKKAKVVDF